MSEIKENLQNQLQIAVEKFINNNEIIQTPKIHHMKN